MGNLTYKQVGVDRLKGDRVSQAAFRLARATYRSEVRQLGGLPAFSAVFRRYRQPFLLGASDGIGTKLKIAFALGMHRTVGIDLVAMSVNDLVRWGAEPIIFLPYLAMAKIEPRITRQINQGITVGCRLANCSILGGETAEMGDFYQPGEYDLAGSAIGLVEKDRLITGKQIRPGDQILALPSSGLHSNGYTLARKVLLSAYSLTDCLPELPGKTLGEELLTPTKIYVRPILKLLKAGVPIHGLAHITGGGLIDKLGKIIPQGLTARILPETLPVLPIFSLIQKRGKIGVREMYHTFNMGVGMVLILPEKSVPQVKRKVSQVLRIGEIKKGSKAVSGICE